MDLESCRKCDLWRTRTKVVVGEGNEHADVMFIGEAPGYYEDQQGRPFVGPAGKFLDELIESIGLKRRDVYITNIVKCRPPGNRDPTEEEIRACLPYLEEQIRKINPKVIVMLGRHASNTIMSKYNIKFNGISQDHGKVFKISSLFGVKKLIPMYHPAAALYNPSLKEELKKDFKVIADELRPEYKNEQAK